VRTSFVASRGSGVGSRMFQMPRPGQGRRARAETSPAGVCLRTPHSAGVVPSRASERGARGWKSCADLHRMRPTRKPASRLARARGGIT
jgi:hypothetical protein